MPATPSLVELGAVPADDLHWVRLPLTWKPVPKMIVSTSCSVPSAVPTRCGVTGDPVGDDIDVVWVSAG